MNNIYLIGMPGSGKSSFGRLIANHMELKHIDADLYLEEKYSMSIPDIFAKMGEKEFRNMETEVIKELSQMDNIIVSTGGGVVTVKENKKYLKNSGIVVFIDSVPEIILNNSNLAGRPLLSDKQKIFDLYNSRIELYRDFADVIIDNNGSYDYTYKQILLSLSTKGND